jgi:capsular polysaccharide biosynthesis protein
MDRVRRYWWLVVGIAAVCALGAVAATVTQGTTYTGRASLIVSSNDRSPDQDAVLVQGYAVYFADPSLQSKLLTDAKVPAGVSVSASAAAASPILLVDATAADPVTAQAAANAVALAFRRDINRVRVANNAAALAQLQRELRRNLVLAGKAGPYRPAQAVLTAVITDIQDRILQIRGDQVNLLQVLQLNGGVSESSPRLVRNVVFGLFGGLIIGVLAALGVGRMSNRLRTRTDISERLGLSTLAELPRAGTSGGARERRLRLRQLADLVRVQVREPAVVAVTAPRQGAGTATVARGLARQWAEQGYPTLLVCAGTDSEIPVPRAGRRGGDGPEFGLVDFPRTAVWAALSSSISPGPVSGMWVVTPRRSSGDTDEEIDLDEIRRLLAQTESLATFVIIEAPPVIDSVDAQLLCAAAGRTLLVVESPATRTAEATEAVAVLEHTNAGLLGAVLVHSPRANDTDIDLLARGADASDLQRAASGHA